MDSRSLSNPFCPKQRLLLLSLCLPFFIYCKIRFYWLKITSGQTWEKRERKVEGGSSHSCIRQLLRGKLPTSTSIEVSLAGKTWRYWLMFSRTHSLLLTILISIQYLFFIIPLQLTLLMIIYFILLWEIEVIILNVKNLILLEGLSGHEIACSERTYSFCICWYTKWLIHPFYHGQYVWI